MIKDTKTLTHAAVLEMLSAAVAKAEDIGQPQCIVILDASGETLGALRMTGSKFLSLRSARTKARTAASIGAPSDNILEAVGVEIAAATGGRCHAAARRHPGGIGIGSGTGAQDVDVAKAALGALRV